MMHLLKLTVESFRNFWQVWTRNPTGSWREEGLLHLTRNRLWHLHAYRGNSLQGKQIQHKSIFGYSNDLIVPIMMMPPGMYLVTHELTLHNSGRKLFTVCFRMVSDYILFQDLFIYLSGGTVWNESISRLLLTHQAFYAGVEVYQGTGSTARPLQAAVSSQTFAGPPGPGAPLVWTVDVLMAFWSDMQQWILSCLYL